MFRMMALAAAAVLSAGAASAQTPDMPLLGGAIASPDCGARPAMAQTATCVTAPLPQIGPVFDAYVAHYKGQGWLVLAGGDNRVIFGRASSAGGCDGMQMEAFYDQNALGYPVAGAPAYVALAPLAAGTVRSCA